MPLEGALSGPSSCGGSDFAITLDMHGSAPENGAPGVRFYRTLGSTVDRMDGSSPAFENSRQGAHQGAKEVLYVLATFS